MRQDAALLALEYDSRWASRKLKVLVRRRRQEAFAQYRLRSFDTPIRDGGRPLSDTLLPTVLPPRIRTGRIGRPRTRQLKHAHCTVCGCLFYYRCSPGRTKQRVACSPACARCLAQRARQILPTDGSVERRYVLRHWSTPKLAKYYGVADPKVVRDHLVKRGVKLRRRQLSRFAMLATDADTGACVASIGRSIAPGYRAFIRGKFVGGGGSPWSLRDAPARSSRACPR